MEEAHLWPILDILGWVLIWVASWSEKFVFAIPEYIYLCILINSSFWFDTLNLG